MTQENQPEFIVSPLGAHQLQEFAELAELLSYSKTWDEIETFDDCLVPKCKRIVSELVKETRKGLRKQCPFLQKEGNFWFYCGEDLSLTEEDKIPSPGSQIYNRSRDLAALQLWCLGEFNNCLWYKKGYPKPEDTILKL